MTTETKTCTACGNVQHAWQNRYCVACWSTDLADTPAPAEATLLSWATYHTNYRLDGFNPPYSVGLVEFDGGPRTQCLLVGDLTLASYGRRVPARAAGDGAGASELTAIVNTPVATVSSLGGPK